MTKAKPATLHERILNDVRDNILSGAWPPGHRIPFETDMAAGYGVSRMTVNKVLTQLTRAGYLERRRKSGTFVAKPRASQPSWPSPISAKKFASRAAPTRSTR